MPGGKQKNRHHHRRDQNNQRTESVCQRIFVRQKKPHRAQRNHRERKPILVLSIFLGWTVLGWIAALIWSYTSQVEGQVEEAK